MSTERPPRFAAWLLSRLLPESERDAILGDLEEEFRTRVVLERGPKGARRWYRSQALRAVRMTWSPTASHDLPPARLFAMGDLLHEIRFAQVRAVSNVVEKRNREAWNLGEAIANLNRCAKGILEQV